MNMKKKQRNLYLGLSAVIVGAVIGIILLTMLTFSADKEHSDLEKSIQEQNNQWTTLENINMDEKEQHLADLQGQVKELSDAFPQGLDSTDVMEKVLTFADEANVKVLPINMTPTGQETVQGETYNLVSFVASVQGSFPALMNFIDKLENGTIETISITNANFSESGGVWTAGLTVKVYSQIGSQEQAAAASS